MMSGLLFELAVRKKSSNVSVLVIVMPIVAFILLASSLSCLCWRLRQKHGTFSSVIDSDCWCLFISVLYIVELLTNYCFNVVSEQNSSV